MNLEQLIDQFDLVTDTEEGFEQFRKLILKLAVRGKLTEQDSNDESVKVLLERIEAEKERLYNKGEIRKPKTYSDIETKEIPFEIPRKWKWVKFGSLGITQTGTTPKTSISKYYGDYIPFLGPGDLSNGEIDYSNRALSEIGLEEGRLIPKSSIIMVCIGGSIGKCNILDRDVSCNQQINTIYPLSDLKPKLVNEFVKAAFFQNEILNKASGSATPIINKTKWENLLFPLPPHEEQHRIVQKIETLFSQVDELEQKVEQDREVDERLQVAVLDDLQRAETPEASRQSWQRLTDHFEQIYRKPEHIDQLKQAILNEAVRGRLVPQNFDNDANSALKEKVDSGTEIANKEVPFEIPDNWIWCKYKDVAKLRHGHQFRKHDYVDDGIPVIKIGQCKPDGSLDLSNCNYIEKSRAKEFKNKLIQKGDLLMALTGGTLGKVTRVDKDYGTIVQNYRVGDFIPNKEFLTLDYLNIILESELFQSLVRKEINQNAQPNIGKRSIENILMAMPPLEEQKRITGKVEELFAWCDDLKSTLSRSQQTDQRLLEALVNGS